MALRKKTTIDFIVSQHGHEANWLSYDSKYFENPKICANFVHTFRFYRNY